MKKYTFILIILLLSAVTLTAFEHNPAQVSKNKGPLANTNLYPFYLGLMNLHPARARLLDTGESELIIANNYANTFNWDRDGVADGFQFDMDVENTVFKLDFSIGATRWLELGVEAAYFYQYGGIFDPVIQGFHETFGFANGGRGNVEDNLFNITIRNDKGTWIELTETYGGLGDLALKAKLKIVSNHEKRFYLALQPAVKIPVADSEKLLSNGELDYGVNLLVEKAGYNYAFYVNIGWIHFGQPENLDIFDFSPDVFNYMFCWEWMIRGGWSVLIQADGNTSPYVSGHKRLDNHSANVLIGFKVELSDSVMLQVSFSEEFFTFATTDIALQTGITIRL